MIESVPNADRFVHYIAITRELAHPCPVLSGGTLAAPYFSSLHAYVRSFISSAAGSAWQARHHRICFSLLCRDNTHTKAIQNT
jgi:hypothetical protein